jgi:hypothetical protein
LKTPWYNTPLGRGLILGGLALVAYLVTRTRDFGGDDTVFALAVDRFLAGKGMSRALWHPHHPFFNPLVAGDTWLLRAAMFHVLTLDVGAAVSAVAAASCVGGLGALLTVERLPGWTVWSACAAAAACGGMWDIATTMEVYCLGALAVLAWLAAISREEPRGVLVGLTLAAAILSHLVLGLLVVPTVVLLWKRPREVVRALAIGLGLSAVAMALVLALGQGVTSIAGIRQVALGGGLGSYLVFPDPAGMMRALLRLVAWGWHGQILSFPPAQARLLDVVGLLAAVVLAVFAATGAVLGRRAAGSLTRSATWGVVAFVPLWLCWDTGNVEHLVAATPLLATLVAVGAATLARAPARAALLATVTAVLVVNGLGSAIPHSRAELSQPLVIATFVASKLPAGTVIASAGRDPTLRLSLPYLSGRHVTDLTLLTSGAVSRGLGAPAALVTWTAELAHARRLVLLPDVTDPATAQYLLSIGIPTDTWRATVARLEPVSLITLQPDGVALAEPFVLTEAVLRPGPVPEGATPVGSLPNVDTGH